jgi:hypothetical protein
MTAQVGSPSEDKLALTTGETGPLWGARPFFIVGAPRCGTTALSKYLAENPDICFAKPKETHFFVIEERQLSAEDLTRRFLQRHFPGLGPEHKAVGEGSVSYLYAPEAIKRILVSFPEARFIVMLRNPVDMIHSYHSRLLYTREEDIRDLSEAWDAQAERAQGRRVPSTCRDPRVLQYFEAGRLGSHLEALFEAAGPERVLPLVFDDFARDPAAVYAKVLEFIGVPPDNRGDFKVKNEHREFKHAWLQSIFMGKFGVPMTVLIRLHQSNWDLPRRLTRPLRKKIKRYNTVPAERHTLDAEMREKLATAFAPEVAKLSALINRDLSHWR